LLHVVKGKDHFGSGDQKVITALVSAKPYRIDVRSAAGCGGGYPHVAETRGCAE